MKRLSKSVRKFIRKEKCRLRRQFLDIKTQNEKIKELLATLRSTHKIL